MLSTHVTLVLLVTLPLGCLSDEPGVIVTRGEHFDDLVRDAVTGEVVKHTLLVTYHNRCPPELQFNDLPGNRHLYFRTFGVENTLQYTWFQLLPSDDLHKRYNEGIDDCQSVLLFKKGRPFTDLPLRWSPDSDMAPLDWVWAEVKVSFRIENTLDSAVTVVQDSRGGGPSVGASRIEPQGGVTVVSYPGYGISVRLASSGDEVFNTVVGTEGGNVVIKKDVKPLPMEELKEEEEQQNRWWYDFQRASACRHLATMKAPLMTPGFSQDGYKIMAIPPTVYKEIFSAFLGNHKNNQKEEIFSKWPFVYRNSNSKATIIPLESDVVKTIAGELQPVLEKFCNCKLMFSSYDGIRENYAGDVVFKHVGEIGNEVISALLQVDYDLASDPWDLELIDLKGQRQVLSLNPGDMMLYERTRIIHGRSKAFGGHTSSEVTFHFVPLQGWDFVRENMEYVNVKTGYREPLGNVVTTLLDKKEEPVVHEEL